MDFFSNMALGFDVALSTSALMYCLLGVTLGTFIGVLPGIGPVATVAMLLPLTFKLDPSTSMIMLAGIYYGAQYGGSTTAILINVPGEHDERGRRVERVDRGQQHRDRRDGAQARQHADERAQHAAEEGVGQVLQGQGRAESQHQVVEQFHRQVRFVILRRGNGLNPRGRWATAAAPATGP